MIKYPDGRIYIKPIKKDIRRNKALISLSSANRGMAFEDAINKSNEYYVSKNIALVYKRPTPINVVRVDYSKGCKIVDAYFEKASTTDYNGVYKGYYLDFEAKSTKIKTSFPLNNITPHQILHLERVIKQNGIAFFLIEFSSLNQVYYLDASYVINYYYHGDRKSIPLKAIKEHGYLINREYLPQYNYLKIIDETIINKIN